MVNPIFVFMQLIIFLIPFGVILPFVIFRDTEKPKNEYRVAQPTKAKRKVGETTLEDLLIEDVEEKRKFHS